MFGYIYYTFIINLDGVSFCGECFFRERRTVQFSPLLLCVMPNAFPASLYGNDGVNEIDETTASESNRKRKRAEKRGNRIAVFDYTEWKKSARSFCVTRFV